MGCFLCTGESSSSSSTNNKKKPQIKRNDGDRAQSFTDKQKVSPHEQPKVINQSDQQGTVEEQYISNMPSDRKFNARSFRYDEIVTATEDFKEDYFLGEGGFGKVYKGRLLDTGEIVAIKQLDRNGRQGIREFVVEAMTLCDGQHENLVKLIGYCADGEHRALIYEYMPLGSLEDNLYDTQPRALKVLDWNTRMKIAAGSAKGLEYLHNTMKIIYRDLKCSNILLGEGYHAKLSDFGLAKVGPMGNETHVSTRIMGTYGYCAPDYAMTGQLTFKSDIYSFGVVLLELITGRRAIDYRRTGPQHNLVAWARPLFKDRKNFHKMADSLLEGQYPVRGLYQSLAIAAMCLQEQPSLRPIIGDVVTALNYLASQTYDPSIHRVQNSIGSPSLRFKRDVVEHRVETKDNGDERTKSED